MGRCGSTIAKSKVTSSRIFIHRRASPAYAAAWPPRSKISKISKTPQTTVESLRAKMSKTDGAFSSPFREGVEAAEILKLSKIRAGSEP